MRTVARWSVMDTLGKSSDTNNSKIRSRTARSFKCVNLVTLCCVLLIQDPICRLDGRVERPNKTTPSGDRNSPDRAFNLALHRRTEIVANSSNAAGRALVTLIPKTRHLGNAPLITSRPLVTGPATA